MGNEYLLCQLGERFLKNGFVSVRNRYLVGVKIGARVDRGGKIGGVFEDIHKGEGGGEMEGPLVHYWDNDIVKGGGGCEGCFEGKV